MIGPSKIWICLIGIIIICTVASGLIWQKMEPPNQDNAKYSIREFMARYQEDKNALNNLKAEMPALKRTDNVTQMLEEFVIFTNSQNRTLVREIYVQGVLSLICYDIDNDGIMEVFERYQKNSVNPDIKEYDINDDGAIEIVEQDKNNDGIIDSSEIKLKFEGKFIPFTIINTIIM